MHCIHHQLSGWISNSKFVTQSALSHSFICSCVHPIYLSTLQNYSSAPFNNIFTGSCSRRGLYFVKILQISHCPWHINKLPLHEEKCRLWLSHFPQALEIWFYSHHASLHLYWISTVGHKVISKHASFGSTFMNERSCQRTKDLNVFCFHCKAKKEAGRGFSNTFQSLLNCKESKSK